MGASQCAPIVPVDTNQKPWKKVRYEASGNSAATSVQGSPIARMIA